MAAQSVRREHRCGFICVHPACCQRWASVNLFAALMCVVIAIQGAYLGYVVGVQTSIERRFEMSSSSTGLLLSLYDIGHTLAVITVGYCGAHRHKPRWTAVGVGASALAMLLMAAPNFIYGEEAVGERLEASDPMLLACHKQTFIPLTKLLAPGEKRVRSRLDALAAVCDESEGHTGAMVFLSVGQLLSGIAAAPFNTLAYIYIDDNVHPRQSPFYLGMISDETSFHL